METLDELPVFALLGHKRLTSGMIFFREIFPKPSLVVARLDSIEKGELLRTYELVDYWETDHSPRVNPNACMIVSELSISQDGTLKVSKQEAVHDNVLGITTDEPPENRSWHKPMLHVAAFAVQVCDSGVSANERKREYYNIRIKNRSKASTNHTGSKISTIEPVNLYI